MQITFCDSGCNHWLHVYLSIKECKVCQCCISLCFLLLLFGFVFFSVSISSSVWHGMKQTHSEGGALWVTEGWSIVNVTAPTGAEWSSSLRSLSSPHTPNTGAHTQTRTRADCWGSRRRIYCIHSSVWEKMLRFMHGQRDQQEKQGKSDQHSLHLDYDFILFF